MADQQQPPEPTITPQDMAGLAERTRKVMAEYLQRQAAFWQDYMQLWSSSVRRFWGLDEGAAKPVIEPPPGDRRFKDRDWSENAAFDFIKQSYLLAARYVEDAADSTNDLDDKTKHKIEFYTKQFIDAMAPSNFAMTNPEVVRATLESKGENLVKG